MSAATPSATPFDANRAAQALADAHARGERYQNLPAGIAPRTVAEAYAAQDAFVALYAERDGARAGAKIATTTPVMQALMGIDHPCGGQILAHRLFASPSRVALNAHINLRIECEVAVRLRDGLPAGGEPHTAQTAAGAVGEVMAAFELIEDRNADYAQAEALTLIAENSWNAGVIYGEARPFVSEETLSGLTGTLRINDGPPQQGVSDTPLEALAWVANLYAGRGQPLQAGDLIITGSLLPTFTINAGDDIHFEIEGLGGVTLSAS
ncbi:MAG: fumarylacetoacetate hydrolase family protein [Pseudomonadota bacterium]